MLLWFESRIWTKEEAFDGVNKDDGLEQGEKQMDNDLVLVKP